MPATPNPTMAALGEAATAVLAIQQGRASAYEPAAAPSLSPVAGSVATAETRHMNHGEKDGLQGAALRGMRAHNELIKKGRLWLRDSPEKPIALAPGFLGAHTPLAFVCATCIGRLRGRGCYVEQLAIRNVFAPESAPAPCDLCA